MSDAQASPLAQELATFARLLPTLKKDEGKFAVIAGDELLGIFETYGDALQCGYDRKGLELFLVKQITSHEIVANFTRSLKAA